MSDIINIDSNNIINIINGKSGIEIGKPFSQEIFLIEVHIAGTTYISNIDELEEKITVGTKLNFYREPENPYDDKAIIIKDVDGNKLGYVPRKNNEILSRLMDAGKLLYGIVLEKNKIGEWVKIQMQVFLKDL
jgi:hypothetical protein